nr:hypothetical protein [Tanacetum cinerariifolium]
NDVDVLKRAQSIYRDEYKGVAFCQQDAWAILKFHPKWDAPEQVDLTGDETKSDATTSTGGSNASTQFGEVMEQELRMKREAAERAFEAQAEKDRTLMRLEELRFLATSTKDLDDVDAYWIKKQKRLIRNKMKNDLGVEDDKDEDEDEWSNMGMVGLFPQGVQYPTGSLQQGVYYPQQGVQTLSGPPQGVHLIPGPSQPPVQFTTGVQQQQGGSFPGSVHLGHSPSMPFHPSQLFASGSQGSG